MVRLQRFVCFAVPALIAGFVGVAGAQAVPQLPLAAVDGLRAVEPAVSSSLEPVADAEIPDAPDAQDRPKSSKRIFGILPNFRSVSTDEQLPAQTVKQKFWTATQDSFDYSAIFVPLALAGYSLGTNADPEFGGGGVGYGRYLWHAAVDQTSENYFVEAIVPSIFHEDTRFYTLSRGSVAHRAGYALTRAVVTRSDSGKRVFNAGEVLGSGMSAGLSTTYYPSRERSFGNVGKSWGLDIGIDAIAFVFKEFAPDITQKFTGGSHHTSTP